MIVDEKVTVGMVNNIPKYVIWKNQSRNIIKIGLHHTFYEGKALYHIFSVVTSTLFMKLKFDTSNLSWKLEEINDAI